MSKTICAISTPLGKGAISIVRMSGKDSLSIARKVFSNKDFLCDITPRFLYLGSFKLGENLNERCLCVYFKSPQSFTGEDMVEFQVHGGSVLTQKILQALIDNGATLAMPGEFSRRAFENGKISLDEAESIIDEINAESESELKASLSSGDGRLKNKIIELQNSLTEEIAEIEATLDYPEEDFEESTKGKIAKKLQSVKKELDKILETAQKAGYIQKGITVAIVGSPNVGKSSLLNALVGKQRAIVTEIAGTTRDTIEESCQYKGVKINFVDTAGIRKAQDKVEKIGIEKSKNSIEQADIVLVVLDGSRALDSQDKEILSLAENKNKLLLINKTDCPRKLQKMVGEIEISALKEKNIDKILDLIYKKVVSEEIDFSNIVVTNQRQLGEIKNAEEIINNIDFSASMDIIAMQIKNLWNCLGKITGQCENEAIIDLIFTKFCLGK